MVEVRRVVSAVSGVASKASIEGNLKIAGPLRAAHCFCVSAPCKLEALDHEEAWACWFLARASSLLCLKLRNHVSERIGAKQ